MARAGGVMKISDLKGRTGTIKLRQPCWHKDAYLEIVFDEQGHHGPWGKLFDEIGCKAIGQECPMTIPIIMDNDETWEEYHETPNH